MKKYHQFIRRLYEQKTDAAGLAVFRITYATVLFCEVLQLFYFRHLIFDKVPFLEPSEIDFSPALITWMIAIVFILLGLFTRQAAIINYLFSLVFIATMKTYEYHMFYLYMGINFLLIFIDVSRVNSLDRLRLKLKYSNTRYSYIPSRKVSALNYYFPVLVGIAFVYFDSIFFKLDSPLWIHGLGLWLPASVPQVAFLDQSFLLNFKPLVIFLGYFSLVFEMAFLFLFGFRRFWKFLFFVGVAFHVGILLIFPIPWFALGVISFYLLLVPASFWTGLAKKIRFKDKKLHFYYDEECPLCIRTKIIISHFDILNAIAFEGAQTKGFDNKKLSNFSKEELLDNVYSISKNGKVSSGIDTYREVFLRIPALAILGVLLYIPGIYHINKFLYRKIAANRFVERCTEDNCGYILPMPPQEKDKIKLFKGLNMSDLKVMLISSGALMLCLLQLISTYRAPLITDLTEKTGFNKTGVGHFLANVSWRSQKMSKIYFGITGHSVFLNSHFDGYNHIIAVQYKGKNKDIWLPIIDKDGRPGKYLSGPIWAKWSFRVNSPEINSSNLENGVRDFSAFWLTKNGYAIDGAQFIIWVKKIDTPKQWTLDFLKIQREKPWVKAGSAIWNNKEIIFDLQDIEKI